MKSIVHIGVLAALLVASQAAAEDLIRWAPDYRTACQLAADQHRLVLLHFYNDNCEPCVRVERNVFSQAQVADAVAMNFHAVKVHAGKDPQLANRYRVRSWPTDVFVTPTGLEVYRSISPQKPDDYVSLVNQVAQQTGVSNSRQWANKLGEAAAPVAAAAATSADQAAEGVRQATEQAAVTTQDNFIQGQQRWAAALEQFKAASDEARSAASQTTQDFMAGARQVQQQGQQQAASAGQQLSQQATNAVNRYEKQGGEAYRQFRDQATQANERVQQQAQQATADAQGAVQQYAQTAQAAASRWQQTFSQTAPAPAPAAAGAPAATPATSTEGSPASLSTAPFTTAPPLLPTDNPWLARQKQEQSTAAVPPAAVSKPAVTNSVAPAAPPLLAQAAAPPATANANPESPPAATTSAAATEPPAPGSAPALTSSAPTSLAPSAWQSPLEKASPPQVAQAQPAAPPAVQPPTTQQAMGQPAPPDYRPGRQLVDAAKAPPIAMDGFCPVTLLETVARDPHDRSAWKKGNVKFGAIHRNRTYLFTSAEQQQKFLANPDGYAPVLSGCDPVAFAERGELLDGKRAYGLITPDKRIYLFADEAALRKFNQSPGSYAAAAQQAMLRDPGHFYR